MSQVPPSPINFSLLDHTTCNPRSCYHLLLISNIPKNRGGRVLGCRGHRLSSVGNYNQETKAMACLLSDCRKKFRTATHLDIRSHRPVGSHHGGRDKEDSKKEWKKGLKIGEQVFFW
jgi:hypothetical protein